LFSYQTGQIYVGLYPYILKWCEDNDVQVVDGSKIIDTKVDEKKVDQFIQALKIPFKVRDYQKEAFIYAVRKNRALLLSPTASGKSLIVYLLVRFNILRLKEKNKKILIIVPTTSLVEQLFKDFKDYGWSPERNVHRIYQGHDKETNKPVIISTWQSIYNMPKKWFKDFEMVVEDPLVIDFDKDVANLDEVIDTARSSSLEFKYVNTATPDGSNDFVEIVTQEIIP